MIVLRDKEYSVRSVLRHLGRGIGTAISQTKANIGARLNSGDIKRLAVQNIGASSRRLAPKTWEAARSSGVSPYFVEDQAGVFRTAYRNGRGVTHIGGGMYKV